MREVRCNKCYRVFRGRGVTCVRSKLVFHFCPGCLQRPEECESFVRLIAGVGPDFDSEETAETRAQAAPATSGALPASLSRWIDELGAAAPQSTGEGPSFDVDDSFLIRTVRGKVHAE